MRALDRWRIEKQEIKYDWKNVILALLVEISLFSVILVLLTITTEMDGIFDRYMKKEMPEMYTVMLENISYSDLEELEKDGMSHLHIYEDTFVNGSFYVNGKEEEDYLPEIFYSTKEWSGGKVVEGKSYEGTSDAHEVWITREMKEEFHLEVGSRIEYRFGEDDSLSGTVAGIVKGEVANVVYIPFDSLEKALEEENGKSVSFCGMGDIDSFINFDFLKTKWKKQGVKVESADLEELLSVIFFMKAVFIGLSVVGMLLCIIAVCNLYGIKMNVRAEFITMLMNLGMRKRQIQGIFFEIFFGINVISVIMAYLIAKFSLFYFNSLLKENFENMYLLCNKLEISAVLTFVTANILMLVFFGRRWKKVR